MTLTGSVTTAPHGLRRGRTCRRAATNTATARTRLIAPAAQSSQEIPSRIPLLARRAMISAAPCQCSTDAAGRTGSVSDTASPTVAKRKPEALSCGISCSRADTVWERSPPESCISSTWPPVPTGVDPPTIRATPGRRQSSLSRVVRTVR